MNNDIPCIYLFIGQALLEKSKRGYNCITHDCIRESLRRRFYHIPNKFHNKIIKELIEFKLIIKRGNTRSIVYEILDAKEIDKKLNKIVFPL